VEFARELPEEPRHEAEKENGMTRKRGTGHAPFCSGGHALDVDCATAYDLAQAKRDKDEAAAQLDAPAAEERV
jgi:hypothetical protein